MAACYFLVCKCQMGHGAPLLSMNEQNESHVNISHYSTIMRIICYDKDHLFCSSMAGYGTKNVALLFAILLLSVLICIQQ